MSTTEKIIEEIVVALTAIQYQPFSSLTKDGRFSLPSLLPTGDGRTIQITPTIDDLIDRLALELKKSRPSHVRTIKDDEWRKWVRDSIGPLLAAIPIPAPAGSVERPLLTALEGALDDTSANLDPREYALGTTLFSNGDVSPFEIGPVIFEPRLTWLDRKVAENDVTPVTQRRIKRVWSGLRIRRRKHGRDKFREDDILKAIGPCSYVCTVRLSSPFAPEAGLETALTTARLGLACSALAFDSPTQALRGFNLHYDGRIHTQSAALFVPGKINLSGSRLSRLPTGPRMLTNEWQVQLTSRSDVSAACGEVLDNLVDPARSTPRPELLEALLHALIWFERGCREVGDLMATLAFAASLDALGKGTKAKGIMAVLEARLDIKRTDAINSHGPSFQSALDTIYGDGRSRTIHGTSQKIGHDWATPRRIAEQLARYALVACLSYVAQTPAAKHTDDLKKP